MSVFALDHSLTHDAFNAVNHFGTDPSILIETDNDTFRNVQVIGKKVVSGIALALLAIVGVVEAIARSLFTGALLAYGKFMDQDVRELVLQSIVGVVFSMQASAFSVYAIYVHIFGDDNLQLVQQEICNRLHSAQNYVQSFV